MASSLGDCRRGRMGAWDVRSLPRDDRFPLMSRVLKRPRVKVVVLLEARSSGSGTTSVGGCSYTCSGRSDGHQRVLLVIAIRVEVPLVDEHLILVRLKHSATCQTLWHCGMP